MNITYTALSTSDILKSIGYDCLSSKVLVGVYAADMLPKKFQIPAAFIVNTDTSNSRGEHWISIYINENYEGEYFDSYGLAPMVKEHIIFLKTHCNKFSYNKIMLQSLTTSLCGHYCCLYVGAKARKFTMTDFVNHYYNKDVYSNDAFTILAFKKYFIKNSKSAKCCYGLNRTMFCRPKRNLTPRDDCI